MDILIAGIGCRSVCDKGGSCFRRRENFKACRTLLHVAIVGESIKKKKTNYFNSIEILLLELCSINSFGS